MRPLARDGSRACDTLGTVTHVTYPAAYVAWAAILGTVLGFCFGCWWTLRYLSR